MQGWIIRRCLSHINRVCGRPYRPRDEEIRRLCKFAGVEWPEPEPRSATSSEEDLGFWDMEEEEPESELETEDEEMDVEVPGHFKN